MANSSSADLILFTGEGAGGIVGLSDLDFTTLFTVAEGQGQAVTALPLFAVVEGSGAAGIMGFSSVTFWSLLDGPNTGSARTGETQAAESNVTLPLFDVFGGGAVDVPGNSAVAMPMMLSEGSGAIVARGESSVTFRLFGSLGHGWQARTGASAVCVSTRLGGMTVFDWPDFVGMAAIGQRILGITETGLFELAGDDDDGQQINAAMTTGDTDLGEDRQKRVEELWLKMASTREMLVSVFVDSAEPFTYVAQAPAPGAPSFVRAKIGLGLKGMHWTFSMENVDGADFDLHAVKAYAHQGRDHRR